MGQTRNRRCYCSKCLNKRQLQERFGNHEHIPHQNVRAVFCTQYYAFMRCRECGHTWKSRSKAAFSFFYPAKKKDGGREGSA